MPPLLRIPAPDDDGARRGVVGPPFHKLLANRLCLDFVNTVEAWLDDGRGGVRSVGERLAGYDDVLAWAGIAGVLDECAGLVTGRAAARDPKAAEAVVRRARALRGALYETLSRLGDGKPAPARALHRMNEELRTLRRGERLVEDGGRVRLEWAGDADALDGVLWPMARSAVGLLTDPALLARVGRCPGERCGWLFLDTSRGRRRRWCDMGDCGNVAKVRAHRARKAPARARKPPAPTA